MEFGFSGATLEAMRGIRGIGAGFGIAKAAAERVGGTITIEDNIGGGYRYDDLGTGGRVCPDRGGPGRRVSSQEKVSGRCA